MIPDILGLCTGGDAAERGPFGDQGCSLSLGQAPNDLAISPKRFVLSFCQTVVSDRAKQLAKEDVCGVAYTMSLEDQRPTDERLQKQVFRRAEELLRGKWSGLWR